VEARVPESPDQPDSRDPAGRVTELLHLASSGDPDATRELLPVVYDELRRLARSYLGQERTGHTLTATALVHEAYLKLVGHGAGLPSARMEFFAAAAQAMRRILVDHARGKKAGKRGGESRRIPLDDVVAWYEERRIDLPELDAALARLAERDARKARVVELRFFAGLSVEQVAQALAIPLRTVERDWTLARAWLKHTLAATKPDTPAPEECPP
jgi:RNA polymerase sigma-70 factor (ECF subfamily)